MTKAKKAIGWVAYLNKNISRLKIHRQIAYENGETKMSIASAYILYQIVG